MNTALEYSITFFSVLLDFQSSQKRFEHWWLVDLPVPGLNRILVCGSFVDALFSFLSLLKICPVHGCCSVVVCKGMWTVHIGTGEPYFATV